MAWKFSLRTGLSLRGPDGGLGKSHGKQTLAPCLSHHQFLNNPGDLARPSSDLWLRVCVCVCFGRCRQGSGWGGRVPSSLGLESPISAYLQVLHHSLSPAPPLLCNLPPCSSLSNHRSQGCWPRLEPGPAKMDGRLAPPPGALCGLRCGLGGSSLQKGNFIGTTLHREEGWPKDFPPLVQEPFFPY